MATASFLVQQAGTKYMHDAEEEVCSKRPPTLPAPALNDLCAAVAAVDKLSFLEEGTKEEVDAFIAKAVALHNLQDAFYVMDLGAVVRLFRQWRQALPRVHPFYAVKCAPHPPLLRLLSALGAGFDCASRAEIDQVMSIGVSPDLIIFANPCKMPSHITHAMTVGVRTMTFDSEAELLKIKQLHPSARLLLRLRTDDRSARCPLGVKYGALPAEWEPLLRCTQALDLPLVGVSFHVGSGARDPLAFTDAIASARQVFDLAQQLGLPPFSVLDIGGGFSTGKKNCGMSFADAAAAVSAALDVHFPIDSGVEIIAEPGRYFAEAPSTLATCVFGRRDRGDHREYWINDGIYGSMNCMLYDHATLTARPLPITSISTSSSWEHPSSQWHVSTVFGPTCDGLDMVLKDTKLPQMLPGDWLVFSNMGAYTAAAGSSFNGFATSALQTFYVYSTRGDVEVTPCVPEIPVSSTSVSDDESGTPPLGSFSDPGGFFGEAV